MTCFFRQIGKKEYRGVAHLVERLLWEQEARSSSLRTSTTQRRFLRRRERLCVLSDGRDSNRPVRGAEPNSPVGCSVGRVRAGGIAAGRVSALRPQKCAPSAGGSAFLFNRMGETRTGRSAKRSRTARWAVRQAACVPAALPPGESPHFDHKKALPPQEGAHFCFIRWERLEWDVDFAGSIPVTPTKNYGLPSHFHGRPFSLSVAYQLLCSEKPGDRPLRGGIRFCYSMFSE